MTDIEIAKNQLEEKNLTICVVKNKKIIYESQARGVYPLYKIYTQHKDEVKGASFADRVIGYGPAIILKALGIKALDTVIITHKALNLLTEVPVIYERAVDHIMNREKTDYCPVEKIAMSYPTVERLIADIEDFLRSIGRL